MLPVYQPPGLDVGDGVARHSVARVLLAGDDDPQLVGLVLHQTHHLEVLLTEVGPDRGSPSSACTPLSPPRAWRGCRPSWNSQILVLALTFASAGRLLWGHWSQLT